jgi:hypothetical protein
MQWLLQNVVSILALAVSVAALWLSYRTAAVTTKLNRSNTLSELYDKMRPGRRAMLTIWSRWATPDQKVSALTPNDRERFQDYYNSQFHNASDSEDRELSNGIHAYLHELHHVWDRINNGEFTRDDVMRKFGDGIFMDKQLIDVYLDAHWRDHGELEKAPRDRFWHNVPDIVNAVESWKASSPEITKRSHEPDRKPPGEAHT